MSANQLYSYDLTAAGQTIGGRSLGPLIAGAKKTDCRAMCVGADGTVCRIHWRLRPAWATCEG